MLVKKDYAPFYPSKGLNSYTSHKQAPTPFYPINPLYIRCCVFIDTSGKNLKLEFVWSCCDHNTMLLDIAFQWTNTFVESLNKEFKTPWKIVFNENWRIDRLPQRFMGGVTWVGCVPASSPGGGWCVRRCPPWSSGTWGGAAWGQQGGGCSDAEISENKLVEQAELAVIVKRKRLHSKQNNQALCTLKHIQLKIYTEWLIEDFNILRRGKY